MNDLSKRKASLFLGRHRASDEGRRNLERMGRLVWLTLQDLESVRRLWQLLGEGTETLPIFQKACTVAAVASATLAEAVILAATTSTRLTAEQAKTKLTTVTSRLAEQSKCYGVDVQTKVHSTVLSEASRWLREHA